MNIDTNQPPLLAGLLNGRNAHFFLDSGSCISLCSLQTLKDYGLSPTIHSSNIMIVGVTRSMNVVGKAVLNLAWGNLTIPHTFVIVSSSGTPGTMLLGHEFLVKANIMLHPAGNCIYFQDKKIDLLPFSRSWRSLPPNHIAPRPLSHHPMPNFIIKPKPHSFACNNIAYSQPNLNTETYTPPS